MKPLLIITSCILTFVCFGQNYREKFIEDAKTGCKVWVKDGYSPADSLTIRWTGGCKDRLAEGNGTLTWYIRGTEVSRYVGFMQKGNPNGQGRYRFYDGVVAEGNFKDGVLNGQGKMTFPRTKKHLKATMQTGIY